MPSSTHPIPEHDILFARCYGHVHPTDVIGWNIEGQIAPRQNQGFVTVVDLSEMTGTDMTFQDINAIYGQLVRHYQPRGQRLFLLLYAPDDLAFGMTRIMQSLSGMTDHVAVQIFRNSDNLKKHLPDLGQSFQDLRKRALQNATP